MSRRRLRGGAVRPWQTDAYRECQDDLLKYARKRGVPVDVPWRELTDRDRRWVIEGEGSWEKKVWYGVRRFFAWLESRAYKMHIRVLLSRYRSYTPCGDCGGARLKPEALLWRLGSPGLNVHELMLLPIERCREFFAELVLPAPLDEAADLLLGEVRSRLEFLVRVGLGYLTLDRQSRTLSGGEVQRINLTTALGTSLVNTLFVLDEPSIGLHPRDMRRVIEVMQRLKHNGNSLLVVEHDPQIMMAADRILDLGPGPGRARRPGGVRWHARGARARQHAHGRLPRGSPRRARRAYPAGGAGTRCTAPAARGRLAAQSPGSRRRDPAQPAGLCHRRVGLGQVDAGARRAVRGTAARQGQADRGAGRAPGARRRRARERCRAGRPDADRAHDALESRELRRRLRCDPQTLRCRGCVDRARLYRRHVQLQFRQRALSDLQRQRFRARRDAVPLRRVSALPGLQRSAIPTRNPRGQDRPRRGPGAQHRRGARDDRRRSRRLLRRRRGSAPAARTPSRGRPRVPAARPARADALRRRGAAAQARRPPR